MKPHYATLDGMRGVAAVAVVWLHFREIFLFGGLPPNAHLAVDFFFCLSGFIVAHVYAQGLKSGELSIAQFAKERAIRLLPLSMLGAALGGFVLLWRAVAEHDGSLWTALSVGVLNVFLIPLGPVISGNAYAYAADPPLWSLFWEGTINALFVFGVLRLRRLGVAAVALAGAILVLYAAWQPHALDTGFFRDDFLMGFCRVLYPFTCGALLRRVTMNGNKFAALLVIGLAGILFGPSIGHVGEALTALLIFPALVLFGAASQTRPVLDRFFRWLGKISYPLYVLHHPALRILAFGLKRFGHLDAAVTFAVVLALLIGSAWIAAEFFDGPVRAWLRNRLLRPKIAPAQAVA